MVEVVTLTGTLTHTGEHGQTAVLHGDVADQLHHVHGLAHTGATEQADLAALGERADQVDHLDAGFQQFLRRRQLVVRRGLAVDRSASALAIGPASSIGLPSTSMMRPRVALPTGTVIGCAGIGHVHAALEAVGGAHRNGTHHAVAQLLLELPASVPVSSSFNASYTFGNLVAREFHVHHGADELNDFALTWPFVSLL